jgi:predicted DNA-binding transcriptional regulator YafY
MPEKLDIYRSYGEKLISLFVRLLFSGDSYSLTQLASMLSCSKQTVLRLLDDITKAYGVEIEERLDGNRKYVSMKRSRKDMPLTPLSPMELTVLQMCRDFTSHLLGKQQFEDATRALLKSQALLEKGSQISVDHFGAFHSGYIDYTPYYNIISTVVKAMDLKKTCRITYKSLMGKKAKTYYINPLKIFSHRDTIYLHAQWSPSLDKPHTEPDFDPLLAIHRIKKVELTERDYKLPKKYDFEKIFNKNFGVMKDDSFEVEIEFTGWAAKYIPERIWSADQKITGKGGNKISLKCTVSSETELISWILSFGEEAKVLKPDWVVEEILNKVKRTEALYTRVIS